MQDTTPHTFSSWLTASRIPYLNFLRNLAPQVVLASLAWMLGLKLDFTTFDLRNSIPTVGFFVYLLAFGWSFWANSTLFLEDLFPQFGQWRATEESTLAKSGIRGWRFFTIFLRRVLKQRPLEGILSIAMLLFLEFVLAGVLASSIAATVNLLRATH